jgi:hypothetical protein
MSYKPRDKVAWQWAGGVVIGIVEEVFFTSVVKEIKGKRIVRHGKPEKPAYLVKSEAGNFALKLESELFVLDNKTDKNQSATTPARKKRPNWKI